LLNRWWLNATEAWRQQVRRLRGLKRETYALYLAVRDPRVPWYVKALAAAVVGYALSPLDLIPDFIPVLGYVDDLLIVPLGVALVLRLMPRDVMAECRERAQAALDRGELVRWLPARIATACIVGGWVIAAALVVWLMLRAVWR
jgi:uncharacterized membrane protein YkvA (DUF1232 family)